MDTLSSSFALARAFMFMGCLAEAEEQALECERMAVSLLHASARVRVRVQGMRAQLLEERGMLQEAGERWAGLGLGVVDVGVTVMLVGGGRYEAVLDDQLAYWGALLLLLLMMMMMIPIIMTITIILTAIMVL